MRCDDLVINLHTEGNRLFTVSEEFSLTSCMKTVQTPLRRLNVFPLKSEDRKWILLHQGRLRHLYGYEHVHLIILYSVDQTRDRVSDSDISQLTLMTSLLLSQI